MQKIFGVITTLRMQCFQRKGSSSWFERCIGVSSNLHRNCEAPSHVGTSHAIGSLSWARSSAGGRPGEAAGIVSFDPPQARFEVLQDGGHLPLLLIAAPLAVHLVRPLPDQGRDRFQAVGGVNADGKFPSYVD